MSKTLQVGNRTITAEEIITLLAGYQMLPQLLRELIIDQAITSIRCTPDEETRARQKFYAKHQLTSETKLQAWLEWHGMTPEQLEVLATRGLKVEKFKQATWDHKLESYLLSRKRQLDKVIYSLIRTKEPEVAQEIYFRIQEGEQTFAELAREYSQGPEAQAGGIVGPVELSTPHPVLAQMLYASQVGQLWPPFRLGDWVLIVRLEKFIPAQLDEPTRARLLNECFTNWLSEQLQQLRGGEGETNPMTKASVLN